ncbi:MAG: sulfatase family protein [Aureliella sp.]
MHLRMTDCFGRSFRSVSALFVCFGLVWASPRLRAESSDAKPHVVFIMVDDMGYGDPQCYNPASKIGTPNIDLLAAEGLSFMDAHAPGPLCHMSRYGLMTGRFPFRTDVGAWRKRPLIQEGESTIASLCRQYGYQTSMVGKWHCGFDESGGYESRLSGGPYDRGFDSFFGLRASTDIPPYFYIRNAKAVEPPTNTIGSNFSQDGWTRIQGAFWREGGIAPNLDLQAVTPRLTQEAVSVIESHELDDSKPLMLYLAYPSPHTPWLPSEEFRGKSQVGMFGDFVMMVDDEIGKVVESLRGRDMLDNTLLIFTSDNGPVWYEKDVERYHHDSAGGLRGMKADAWEAGHRMPFIVRWPAQVEAGAKSDRTICFTDVFATLAQLLGHDLKAEEAPDSISFLDEMLGVGKVAPRPPIVMSPGAGESMMMIRSGKWKLIKGLGSGGFSQPKRVKSGDGDPQGQLYNLEMDQGEKNNLYATEPETVARLLNEMKVIIASNESRSISGASAN